MHIIARQASVVAIRSFRFISLIASVTALIALAIVFGVWVSIEALTLII